MLLTPLALAEWSYAQGDSITAYLCGALLWCLFFINYLRHLAATSPAG